jgi:hypothetical protein
MRISVLALVLFVNLIWPNICCSQHQYVGHSDQIKIDTLIDKELGVKFIVDKERIFITAVDSSGKILWKTDPYTDSKIKEYRTKRPTLVYFAFSKNFKDAISIAYNNSQFGYIYKATGGYHYQGQD